MPTDPKTLAAYNAYAAQWTERMRSGSNIAHTLLEKPAMYGKIPNLCGKAVLCIGCGGGEECRHLQSLGATRIVGTDISSALIAIARQTYTDIDFSVMDMEQLDFPDQTFDFIYSSLALHYVADWTRTLRHIHRILRDDGTFLFSTHHPLLWGAAIERTAEHDSVQLGYTQQVDGTCDSSHFS